MNDTDLWFVEIYINVTVDPHWGICSTPSLKQADAQKKKDKLQKKDPTQKYRLNFYRSNLPIHK